MPETPIGGAINALPINASNSWNIQDSGHFTSGYRQPSF
jgi:hypothetical protein